MNENKLKIGLLIDDYNIPFWAYRMLEKIVGGDYAEVKLIVKNSSEQPKEKLFRKIQRSRRHLLYILYRKIENKLFKQSPDAFELKDVRDLLSVDVIDAVPLRQKFSDRFNEDDLEK